MRLLDHESGAKPASFRKKSQKDSKKYAKTEIGLAFLTFPLTQ